MPGTDTVPASSRAVDAVACTHCGLPVPTGLVEPGDAAQFCCNGCRAAFGILNEHGLEQYYSFGERREGPVRLSGRSFEEFDHPAFRDLYVRPTAGGLSRVTLVLEGVHCASCVWLVERVPLLVPGVARAELDIRRALVTIEWDPASIPLSAVARTLESLGYPPHPFRGGARDAVRRRDDRAALVRIGVAGAIAINVMLAALAMYAGWFSTGLEREYERFFRWLSLILVIPAVVWPGRVFFRGAWAALRTRTLHLDLPIAIALGAGFVRGTVNTIRDQGPVYLDGVAILIFLLLVGRYLQQRWQRAAIDASELLHSLTPQAARVVDDDPPMTVREVPAGALLPGMLLDVRAGDTLAADGVVESGESSVNTAWLTGESRPARATPGTPVFAGTVNVTAPIRVRVRQAGEATRVARVLQQVEESARRRAPVVLFANRLAGVFVGSTLVLAALTWAIWLQRDPTRAVDNAIALLVVTCPCALAMATPLSVTVALGRAARIGIFIKGGDALELLAHPSRIYLDKTGTITAGQTALVAWSGPDWVKPLVLAAEAGSPHPIADGFRRAWPDITIPLASHSEHTLGGGIRATVEGHDVAVGSPGFVRTQLGVESGSPAVIDSPRDMTLTPVWVAVDGDIVGVAGFGDPIRADAAAAIEEFEARGWRVGILSGDDRGVASAVAQAVGIDPRDVIAEAAPEAKLAAVERARNESEVVMIGDGVNDASAIAAASVGVAVHGGAEAALASADVYITRPGLEPVVRLLDGAHRTMRVIRRNIAFSLVYNVVGIGLAITGVINPVIAAVMMPLSSLTVVAGAWYGRTFEEPA
jgi:Cu2+-exporting ATPase